MADDPQRTVRCLHPRTLLTRVAALCLLLSAPLAQALGFGPPQTSAVLGQALRFTLPVHLQAGERFDASCVRAEVQVGERRLPAYELRLSVGPGTRADERLLQLSTLGRVDELVVAVQIDSACAPRLSRRFTLLSQPVSYPAAAMAAAGATGPAATARRSAVAANPRAAATPRARPTAGNSLTLEAGARPAAAAALPVTELAAASLASTGLQAVVAQAAAQVAGDQIKALEQQVLQALAEARRQQDQLGQLQHRLAAAESANRWLPWLLLGLVGAGALALWLALRVRRLLREQARQAWATGPGGQAEAAPATGATALLSPDQPLLSRMGDLAGAGQAAATQPSLTVAHPMVAAVAAAASSPPERSLPASDFALGSGVPPRPVSVEELLDLDQQADFFLVLGQEQAAVDLLLSHVRSTGGTSALPYFKLLEIYRQQGEEEAYERTRERFNQRFNAFAPDWSGDLAAGRGLEDYADVIERLQRAWPQPLRTVAELESLLLRRADLEPFDMPAYRDVLMLHALVRDLPASPVAGGRPPATEPAPPAVYGVDTGTGVDLLLPLGEAEQALDITVPRPHLAERVSAQSMLADWVFRRQAEGPLADAGLASPGRMAAGPALERVLDDEVASLRVDLDLSDFAPAPREFTRPAAFTDIDHRRDSRLSDLAAFDDSDLLPPSLSRR